jgi:hypothetical protein
MTRRVARRYPYATSFYSVNRAVELVREGERVLFLSPTKELSTKTAANELRGRVRSRVINEDTVGKGNVTARFF